MISHFKGNIYTGQVDFELNPDVNILVGINGSGKTLLLEALAEYARENGISYAFHEMGDLYEISKEACEFLKTLCHDPDDCFWNDGFSKNFAGMWRNEFSSTAHYSAGERRFLSLISFFFQNKDKELLLIDTPEPTLHIVARARIIDICLMICAPAQVVVATHSPSVLRGGWFGKARNMSDIVARDEG